MLVREEKKNNATSRCVDIVSELSEEQKENITFLKHTMLNPLETAIVVVCAPFELKDVVHGERINIQELARFGDFTELNKTPVLGLRLVGVPASSSSDTKSQEIQLQNDDSSSQSTETSSWTNHFYNERMQTSIKHMLLIEVKDANDECFIHLTYKLMQTQVNQNRYLSFLTSTNNLIQQKVNSCIFGISKNMLDVIQIMEGKSLAKNPNHLWSLLVPPDPKPKAAHRLRS